MDGGYIINRFRIYSLHNQIFKWKEIKLLNDFDKKIQNIQKIKVDAYKNAAAHSFTLKYLLKQNNYITKYPII